MAFFLEANGYIEFILTLNERKACQATSSRENFERPVGNSNIEHWPLVEGFPCGIQSPVQCLPGGKRGRFLRSRGHLHLQGCVFFPPLTGFLLSRCGCFLNGISSRHQERKSVSAWRGRFFGNVFLSLGAQQTENSLLFDLSYTSFFPFRAGSLIRAAFRQTAPGMPGIMNGAFLVLLASLSLCAASAPCIINHLATPELCP